MLIDLLEPVLNVIEGLLICAVIDQNNTHSSLVVSLGDGPESFLSCSVPYLQLNALIVNVNLFDLKVNPDGGHMTDWEAVVCESEQDASLTNT
jgi:hypothetical protein